METKLASVSNATWGLLIAHPVAAAVVGGVLLGTGAYYLGKAVAKGANKQEATTTEAEAAA